MYIAIEQGQAVEPARPPHVRPRPDGRDRQRAFESEVVR